LLVIIEPPGCRPAPRARHHRRPRRPGRMGNPARQHRRAHRAGTAVSSGVIIWAGSSTQTSAWRRRCDRSCGNRAPGASGMRHVATASTRGD